MDDLKRTQISILIRCCITIGCSIGLISNCLGLFFTPLAESLGTGRGQVAVISTIISLSSAFFAQVVARLIKKFPINHVMAAGVCVTALGYLMLSFAKALPVFYITAIFIGVGDMCFKNLTVSIILRSWFGDKSASKLGIAMAVTGIVAAVMNPVLSHIIQTSGYPAAFRLIALLLAVLGLPSVITLRLNPDAETTAAKKAASGEGTKIPRYIYILICMLPVFIAGTTGMNTHFSSYAVSLGYTLSFGATVVSFQSVFNSVWKLIYGFVAEKLGPIRTCIAYLIFNITACTILIVLRGSQIAIILGVCLYAAAFSMATVGMPVIIQDLAKERYAEVFATANMLQTLFYALYTSVYGSISDLAGNYIPCLLFAIFLASCCIVVLLLLGRESKKAAQVQ